MSFITNLDTPLLALSRADRFTLRDACAGVHCFGGIGSGKTSGSGKALAGAYLRAGMGALILSAKPEEVELWLSYAEAHGRLGSVIVFDGTQGFNFIEYELARQGLNGISNVTECLMRVLESADHAMGAGGNPSDPFWQQSTRQILNYTIPVLYSAHREVTVSSIIDFVVSAATKPEQYGDEKWCESSLAARTLRKLAEDPAVPMERPMQQAMLEYWFQQYPAIPEKTRGNIVISLSSKLDRFKHGRMQSAFCNKTTIIPEMTFHGSIIIMAMPALTWNEDGIVGQQLFKFMWQRAVESRNGLARKHQERPVFLWADEAQYFCNVKDEEFLSTCRGSRACVVYLTQNLPAYYARLGKDKSDAADGLVGKFNTHIFHQNACPRTNEFASKLIGRAIQLRNNVNRSTGTSSGTSRGSSSGINSSRGMNYGEGDSRSYNSGVDTGSSSTGTSSNWGQNVGSGTNYSTNESINEGSNESRSWGASEHMDFIIEPNYFTSALLSGGAVHKKTVTALWFKVGANFHADGEKPFLLAGFRQ